MFDATREIKHAVQPIFRRPYLSVKLQNVVNAMGLYDTGADISCINARVFERIPSSQRPRALPVSSREQFRAAGGHHLKVNGQFEVNVNVEGRDLTHNFFVIENLNEPIIFGIDFIERHELNYCASEKVFRWKGESDWGNGHLKVCALQKLPPLSVNFCKVKLRTEGGAVPNVQDEVVVNVNHSANPCITGGPYLVTPDSEGYVTVPIYNCGPSEFDLNKNDFVGVAENASKCEKREINPKYLSAVSAKRQNETLSKEKLKFITDNVNLTVPDNVRQRYLDVILQNHECISRHKFDLGRTETLLHEISLKTDEPIYVKQFRIPDAHREEVEKHVTEWLKMGVVQPARSKYNSPIFAVAKKNGGIRLVQDFRALNAETHIDKYSMKDVSECIGEIGRSGSCLFTTIDLTGGFWQMLLQPKSRPYTAFTVPGKGQFQWVTSPMGLLGCPSSFQRLMETVVHGLQNVIVYIDDLLVHSSTHDEHLELLDQLLKRLVQHNVKINLSKCFFGSKNVAYLGFRLTEEGVKPGSDKLKAVEKASPPENVHEVRQFLGLCNFFRTHVRNFAQLTAPLTAMTRKDCGWKGGELPKAALQSFRELQSYLCSEPIVAYPRRNRTYTLITDASLGLGEKPGGLGAILTQLDEKGEHHVIAYASRKLQKHECNYTPFLLEMQAALWGMDHFDTYLRGRPFILFTDHRPLEKLGKVHTKTLNRLQEAMGRYNFEIMYKKGSEMPADYLSRNVVAAVNWEQDELVRAQGQDNLIRALKNFLLNKELPQDSKCQQLVRHFSDDCFVENDLVWKRVKRKYEPSRVVIFLPETLIEAVLQDAHGHLLSGHDGIFKTKERLFQCFYWPGMDTDIANHLQRCHKCQIRRKSDKTGPVLVTPLPQPTEPNQRIHADLFGPLRTSGNSKKYVLCITDAFTKYVELVALPNKEAPTVAQGIFERWFCRFGMPLDLVTDQGKEFCSQLSEDLFKLMQVSHLKTTAYHPQCNSQAEVANKTIAKYLASFVDESTLDWEDYLPPLMFVYNTSFHRSVKTTPFFLTFGMEPRHPSLPTPDVRRKFYGESSSDELMLRLLTARDVARRNNEDATETSQTDVNKRASPHAFSLGQLVLLDEHSFLGKNAKLAPKWTGPHRILKLKHENNVEIKLKTGRSLITHVNRLKPYQVPLGETHEFKENILDSPASPNTAQQVSKSKTKIENEFEDYLDSQSEARPMPNFDQAKPVQPSMAMPEVDPDVSVDKPSFIQKRGRGRPRKTYADAAASVPMFVDNAPPPQTVAPPPPPIVSSSDSGMKLRSGRSYQPAVAGGGNPDVQVSVINTDDEWVTVIRGNKDRKKTQWGKWSKLERRNFAEFGDTYKTILCEHEDPVQAQVPAQAVIQVPAPILVPAVVPQNVAIPHPHVGPPHLIPRSPSPQRKNVDDGNSDRSSPVPSLPTDTEYDFRSAEGGPDSASESDEPERTLDRSDHRNRSITPSRFTNYSDIPTYENLSPTNSARSRSPLRPSEAVERNPFATSSKLQRSPNPFATSSKVQRSPIPVPRQFPHTDGASAFPVPPPRTSSSQRAAEAVVDPFRRSTLTPAEAAQIPPVFRPTATRSSGRIFDSNILSNYPSVRKSNKKK